MVMWTHAAKTDLRNIHDFIAHDSAFYAKKVAQEITEKADIIENHPFMGRKVSEIGDESIREISAHSYRVIYQRLNGQVFIFAVVHKRRILKHLKRVD